VGVSQADVTTQRLVDKIDLQATTINCLTACAPEAGKIPLAFPTDREAIEAALKTIRPCETDVRRLVHIKYTLALYPLMVSEGCLGFLKETEGQSVEEEERALTFDSEGNMVS